MLASSCPTHMQFPHASYPVHVTLAGSLVHITPKKLGMGIDANAISNFLDAHLLESGLVQVHEVFASDVVLAKRVHILRAIDALQPFAHTLLVPVYNGAGSVLVRFGELGLGRRGEDAMAIELGTVLGGGHGARE